MGKIKTVEDLVEFLMTAPIEGVKSVRVKGTPVEITIETDVDVLNWNRDKK